MKNGKNMFLELIENKISDSIGGLKTLLVGKIINLSPLSVQPLALTADGKKRTPMTDCRQLDFKMYLRGPHDDGTTRQLKLGDDVLVGVISESLENYSKGKSFREDPNRSHSVDSSIVLGVIK